MEVIKSQRNEYGTHDIYIHDIHVNLIFFLVHHFRIDQNSGINYNLRFSLCLINSHLNQFQNIFPKIAFLHYTLPFSLSLLQSMLLFILIEIISSNVDFAHVRLAVRTSLHVHRDLDLVVDDRTILFARMSISD